MNPKKPPPPEDANGELFALIETLHQTGQRLEELTAGEVDTVADRDGRTFMLRRAQDQLRHSEAAKQAAILNALPLHIALLDTQGRIISVNEAWLRLGSPNVLHGPGYGIGLNYLEICDSARGDDASEAHQIAEGIRSVLDGGVRVFSMEYPCHSPTEQRWFLLTVTPLTDDHPNGAVVIHVDITERKRGEEALRRLGAAMDAVADAIYLVDRSSMCFVYVNDAACRMQNQAREELLALEPWIVLSTSRAELERVYDTVIASGVDARPTPLEMRRRREDGSHVWVELRRHAQRSGDRWTIVTLVRDITERKRAEQALVRLAAIIEATPDMVSTGNPNGHVLYYNRAGLRMLGCEQGLDLSTVRIADDHPDWAAKLIVEEGIPHAIEHGTWSGETALLRRDGREIPTSQVIIAHKGPDGSVEYTSSIVRDITLQKEHEKHIMRLNRVYAVLSGINTIIVRTRDRLELFDEACRIALEHGHFKMAWIGVVDRSAMKVVPIAAAGAEPEFLTRMKDRFSLLEDAPLGNTMSARAVRERKAIVVNDIRDDAKVMFAKERTARGIYSLAILPLLVSDEAVGVLALYADEPGFFDAEEMKLLTELAGDIAFGIDHIDKRERLDYLAYYDVLTGLANRTLFLVRVAQYIRSAVSGGHKLAVFLIDLERFKNINDSLGRPAGDALLRQVAEWLRRNAGDAFLLARVGADCFAVVLQEVQPEGDVARLLEKSMKAFLNFPFRLDDAVFRIAAKVGVALFPDDGADADTLFKHAEAALKQAKASGERYLFYTQRMTATVAGKLTLENQLRQALDKGEFVLHYQPKVNLASGKVTSAEALIRWNDPRTGLVPPGQFIPILEETGLIYEVGRWALRQALDDYLRWRAAGLPAVRIAVNVSPLQLRSRGFLAEIEHVIGIDAHAAAGLELELTESLLMADVKHSIASLQALRAMGVSIAIDDFGTGFSSLSYLAKLPVNTLKIDHSFVIDMTAEPEGLALVSTIINLAHSLELTAVADGVETEEQSRLLRLLRCDEMQGFIFSKPLPGKLFETRYLVGQF